MNSSMISHETPIKIIKSKGSPSHVNKGMHWRAGTTFFFDGVPMLEKKPIYDGMPGNALFLNAPMCYPPVN